MTTMVQDELEELLTGGWTRKCQIEHSAYPEDFPQICGGTATHSIVQTCVQGSALCCVAFATWLLFSGDCRVRVCAACDRPLRDCWRVRVI